MVIEYSSSSEELSYLNEDYPGWRDKSRKAESDITRDESVLLEWNRT